MDLNKILELVACLEKGYSLHQCAKKLKINVSPLTRSLLKVGMKKWILLKINLHRWVKHYASFRKSIHKRWTNWIYHKWKNVLDLLYLAKQKLPGLDSYSLENLGNHFQIDLTNAHNAIADVEITKAVYQKLTGI